MQRLVLRRERVSKGGAETRSRWRVFVLWQIHKIRESFVDRFHNVDTFRGLPANVHDSAWPYRYNPTPRSTLRHICEHLNLVFSQYTFIDMGAGKGRIVLAAYAFPFIDFIGVENTPMLCRIAEKKS